MLTYKYLFIGPSVQRAVPLFGIAWSKHAHDCTVLMVHLRSSLLFYFWTSGRWVLGRKVMFCAVVFSTLQSLDFYARAYSISKLCRFSGSVFLHLNVSLRAPLSRSGIGASTVVCFPASSFPCLHYAHSLFFHLHLETPGRFVFRFCLYPRPCNPLFILNILKTLFRVNRWPPTFKDHRSRIFTPAFSNRYRFVTILQYSFCPRLLCSIVYSILRKHVSFLYIPDRFPPSFLFCNAF